MSRTQNKFTDRANCYFDPSEPYYRDHGQGWPTSYDALPVSDVESTPWDCQPGVDELQEASSASVPLLAPWSGRKHRVAAWIGGSSEYAASVSDVKALTPRGLSHSRTVFRRTRSSALPSVPTPRFYHVSKANPLPPPGKQPTTLCMPLLSRVDPETATPRCKRLHSRMKNIAVPITSPSWSRRKSMSGDTGPYPYQLSYTSHGGQAPKMQCKRHYAKTPARQYNNNNNNNVTEFKRSSVTMEPSVSGFSRYGSSSVVDGGGRRAAVSDAGAATAHDEVAQRHVVAASKVTRASRRCRRNFEMGFGKTPGRGDDIEVVDLSRSRRIREEFEANYVEGHQGRGVVELNVSRSRPNRGNFDEIGDVDASQGHQSVEVKEPRSRRSRENFDTGYENYREGRKDVGLNFSRPRRGREDFETDYKDYLQGHENLELNVSRSRRSRENFDTDYDEYRQGHGKVGVGVSRSCRVQSDIRCCKPSRKKKRPKESEVLYLRRSRTHVGSEMKLTPRSDTTTDQSALIRRNYRKGRKKAGSSSTSLSIRGNTRFKHGAALSPNGSSKLGFVQHLSASNLSGDDLAAVIKARSQSLDARLATMEQNMFDKQRRVSPSVDSTASAASQRQEPPVPPPSPSPSPSLFEPRVPEDVRTKRLTQEHLVKACSLSAQAIPDAEEAASRKAAGGDPTTEDETLKGLMSSLEKIGCGHLKVNLKGILHRMHKTDSSSTAAGTKATAKDSKNSSTDPREAYEEIYKQQSLKCILSKPKLSTKFKPKKEINFEELLKQKIDRSTLGLQVQELWTHSGNFRTATPQSSKTEQDEQPGNQTLSQTLIDVTSVAGGATADDEPGSEVKFEERWSTIADPNMTRPETSGAATNQRAEPPYDRTWTRPAVGVEKPEAPTNLKIIQENGMRYQKIYGKFENSPQGVQQHQNYDQNSNANQTNVEFIDAKCQRDTTGTTDPQHRNPKPNLQQQQQQQQQYQQQQQQQQHQQQHQQQQQQWAQQPNVNETNAEFRDAKRQQDTSPPEVQHQQWREQSNVNTESREAQRPQDTITSSAQNRGVNPNVQQQHLQYQQQQHQQWCQLSNSNQVRTEFVETMRPQDSSRTDAQAWSVEPDAQADNWNRQQPQQNNYRVDSRQESWQQSRLPNNSPDHLCQPFPADHALPERQLGLRSTAHQSFAPENGNAANTHQQVYLNIPSRPATATQVVAELDEPRLQVEGLEVSPENYARHNFEAYRTSPVDLVLPEVNSQGDWTLQANTSPVLEQHTCDVINYPERRAPQHPNPRGKWVQQQQTSQQGEPNLLPTRVQGRDKWRQPGGNIPPPPTTTTTVCDDWFERPQKTPQQAVPEPQPNFIYRVNTNQRSPIGDSKLDAINVKPDRERSANAVPSKVTPVRRLLTKMADPRQNKMAATRQQVPGTQDMRAQLLRRAARQAASSEEARTRGKTTLPTSAPLKFPVFVGSEGRADENWQPKIRVQTKFQDLRPPTETIHSKFLTSNPGGWNVQSAGQTKKKSKFPAANVPAVVAPDEMAKLKTDYYKFWEQSQRCDPNVEIPRPNVYVGYPDMNAYPTAQVVNRQCPANAPVQASVNYRTYVTQTEQDFEGSSDEDDDGRSSVKSSKSYMLHMIDQVVNRETGSVLQPPTRKRRGGGSYFNLAVDEAIDLVKSESLYGLDQGLCKDITQSLTDSLLGCKSVNSVASCDKCVKVAKKAQWLKEFRCDSLRNISNVVTQLQKLERVSEETHCKDHAVLFPTHVGTSG